MPIRLQPATRESSPPWRTVGLLLGIAALFMAAGTVTLYVGTPSTALTPWRLIILWGCWLIGWGGTVLYLAHRCPQADTLLLPPIALLTGWGLLFQARLAPNFLNRQLTWLLLGLVLLCALSTYRTLTRQLRRYRYTLLAAGLLLLAATLRFGVNPSGWGTRLWLGAFGFYFQPSELLKLLLLIYLAAYLADRREIPVTASQHPALWPAVFGPMLLMIGLALVLLAWQDDLGAALLFYLTALAMLYLAWGRLSHVLGGLFLFIPVVLGGALLSARVALRVSIWLDPWAPAQADRAFQILQSLFAMAEGGLFGKGLGLGRPDLIPVVHSDFVYAAVVNEFGIVGALALLGLLAMLIQRSLRLAQRTPAPFEALLAGGIAAWIGIQSYVIIGGNLKLLPLTGVTLPFLSYGGSSLVTLLLATGLLLNISTPHPLPANLPLSSRSEFPPLHRNLERLGGGLLALLMLSALSTGYWAVWRADALRRYPTNPHRILAELRIRRGRILDRRGVVLADIALTERGYVQRTYPVPEAAPVLGYTSLEYGNDGIEAACDKALRGEIAYDAWQATIDQLLQRPRIGQTLRLTLDARLQQQAHTLLKGQTGAIVLADSRTGEILALASAPTYHPAQVSAEWATLRDDPAAPLLNRVTQAPVQPGGALQTLIAAAALEHNLRISAHPTQTVTWNGYALHCRTVPATLSWEGLLAAACPAPFAFAGRELGIARLAAIFEHHGLTTPPPFELPVLIAPWQPAEADPMFEALGQGALLITPLQLAGVVTALANDGVRPPLHLLISPQPGCVAPATASQPVYSPAMARRLREAWPQWGTAVGHLSQALAGPDRQLTWFLGINSTQLPRFAVIVLLENTPTETLAADIGVQLLQSAVNP